MAPDEFIVSLKDAAIACMEKTGIPASFTVAQAALESSWGGSKLSSLANNLFGVKAGSRWEGETVVMKTTEYDSDGKAYQVDALWRKYSSLQDCLDDHAKVILLPRYRAAFIHKCGGDQFANYIAAGGYATDPNYASKIQQVIYSHNLLALDEESEP